MNSIIGILAAIIAYLFFKNKKLQSKVLDTELKNDKEKLNEQEKKTSNSRNRLLDLLDKYRNGK